MLIEDPRLVALKSLSLQLNEMMAWQHIVQWLVATQADEKIYTAEENLPR